MGFLCLGVLLFWFVCYLVDTCLLFRGFGKLDLLWILFGWFWLSWVWIGISYISLEFGSFVIFLFVEFCGLICWFVLWMLGLRDCYWFGVFDFFLELFGEFSLMWFV